MRTSTAATGLRMMLIRLCAQHIMLRWLEEGVAQQQLKVGFTRRASWEHIVLNHYVLKSREEFAAKVARSNGMNDPKPVTYFDEIDALAIEDCTYAAELYPATQA